MLKNNLKIFLVSIGILVSSALFASIWKVDAAVIQTTHSREYIVQDDFIQVKESKLTEIVQENFEVSAGQKESFSIFNPVEDDPQIEEKKKQTLDSVKVTDKFGTELEYTVVEEEGSNNAIIEVPISNSITFFENSEIFLTYKSYGLIINTGAIKDIYIPGFPENFKEEENDTKRIIQTKVRIPKEFEEINFISPESPVTTSGEDRIVDIPLSNQLGSTTWIQLGKKQFFEFEISQKLPATSNIPLAENTFRIPVPRDIVSGPVTQKVYYKSDQLNPKPSRVYFDEDENLIFEYKYAAASSMDVYIKGYAEIIQDEFDISNAGTLSDIPEDFSRYVQSGNFWEVDSEEIQRVANELKGDKTDVNEIVQTTYEYVIDQIDYSFVKKFGLNERQGALATLNGGAAVCMEYSDLFIALVRAQGVPARAAFGLGYGSLDYLTSQENDINHQWAEIYLPNQDTWIAVDTTWGDFGSTIIGGDLNHFYSHVASIDPDTPSTSEISYVGNLDEIPERDMNIFIVDSLSEEDLVNVQTPTELVDEFDGKVSFIDTIKTKLSDFDIYLNSKFESILGLESTSIVAKVLKLVIFAIPISIILFILLSTGKRVRRRVLRR